ncbi:hypothetical protein FRC07_004424 [Ceratobasidium sp. 392]|nr:hypothetical protein FRC07_004424 [Ceratobasidium sp. 392]
MKLDSESLFANLSEDVHAAALELVGTTFWLTLALGGIQGAAFSSQANGDVSPVPSNGQLLYISASMGLSLLVSVWLFFRVTGGVFNPAISTALLLVGAIGPVRWVLYCIAQMVGAIVASALLLGLLPGKLDVTPKPSNGVNSAQAVFIEAFLTAALVFAVLILAAEKHRTTPFAPVGIGLTLFAGHLWGVVYTGAAMNTARAFGPAVVSGFEKHHWVSSPRAIIQIVIVGAQILGKAFAEAGRQAARNARHRPPGATEGEAAGLGNATSGSATDRATREHKMTVDEAQLILNVKPEAALEEIVKRYEILFKQNSPPAPPEKASGAAVAAASKKTPIPNWSHYLQSKVVRARERLEAEMQVAAEDGTGKQSTAEGKAEEKPGA